MKRIAILTAGGDTPALNASIHGAAVRANQLERRAVWADEGIQQPVESARAARALEPAVSAVIPELDPTKGGTLLGGSRDYIDRNDKDTVDQIIDRLERLGVEGLICIGGDGTLNGVAAAMRSDSHGALPQDDRQRPGTQLSERSRRLDARALRRTRPAIAISAQFTRCSSIWSRWSTTSRPAMPRPCSFRPAASSACAPRPKVIAASRSSRSWAGTRASSRWAQPTASPTWC